MKRFFLFALLAVASWQVTVAQLNTTLVSNINFDTETTDVWGWVDDDGTEYALVGNFTGVSVVNIADPSNPFIADFAEGVSSGWRDIKSWGDFAYVTNETGDGIMVIDMSYLPDSVSYYNWEPFIPELGTLESAHNLYIDEHGMAYISGANINSGGILFVDVASTPGQPQYVAHADARYSHDVYVRGDTMYSSDIYAGFLSISDVSQKDAPVVLATQPTPFSFTHNAWISDDGKTVFTTDERANAPVAAYDISDLNNITLLDEFRPLATINQGVIPHNVHVLNDFLVISHYTDGGVIVDAHRPDNLIEVGQYDTFLGASGGFGGNWGAYPFLPSGLILLSDRSGGLFIVEPNYVRACYLEGQVTDAMSGEFLADVEVEIQSEQVNQAATDTRGIYKTGQAAAGTFDVTFSKFRYRPKTVSTTLENGELTTLDVELEPLPTYTISGQAVKQSDGSPVPNAQVIVINENGRSTAETNAQGEFVVEDILEGSYTIYAGAWGYQQREITNAFVDTDNNLTIELEVGYEDDFVLDLGWETSGTATAGLWERGEPVGTQINGGPSNPNEDIPEDIGSSCYVTGNAGGGPGDDDVDDGSVVLTSPIMDLTIYENPTISYRTWFFNSGGDGNPNDTLTVSLSNGVETVILEHVTDSRTFWTAPRSFAVTDYLGVTDSMRISFETADQEAPFGHIVEAGVDGFRVDGALVSSTQTVDASTYQFAAFPNPVQNELNVQFELSKSTQRAQLHLYNLLGQRLHTVAVDPLQQQVQLSTKGLENGVYFLLLDVDGTLSQALRIVKTN